MASARIEYEDYVGERQFLSNIEQRTYEGYEKTILTLSAAFLAFSVSFVGLFSGDPPPQPHERMLSWYNVLIWAWVFFSLSVFSTLGSFLAHAKALRREVGALEAALKGKESTANRWIRFWYGLLLSSGFLFVIGVVLLLLFCAKNLNRF